MIPTNDEKYEIKLYKRVPNSAYEYEASPSLVFKGRPASQLEKKVYRVLKGVNGGTDSTFVKATNLPQEVNVNDKVVFLGKEWTVMSIGYYFDDARFINPAVLSEDKIIERCPKGLNLQ